MSEANGPVRRRRIAGEAKPAAPVSQQAPVLKRPPSRRAAARKAAAPSAPTDRTTTPAVPARKPAPRITTAAPPVAERPSATTAPEPVARRDRPSRRDLALLVPLALVAILALVGGGYLVANPPGGSDADITKAQQQASSAAASAAETIFSFQYDKLDEHLTTSKALMTPAFAKDFDKIAPALTELAPQRRIQVKALARESAALPCGEECSASKVSVLVFIDQARVVGSSDADPTVFANRIKVQMVKRDSGWLVNQIDAI
jgi:Mce-associated membrane protein